MIDLRVKAAIEKNGYTVDSVLGEGGFATCYKVFSKKYNDFFVCKVIPTENDHEKVLKESFENEFSALTKVIHPNIINIFKRFETPTHLFLIIEYCEQGDMEKYLKENRHKLSKLKLLGYASNVINALAYLESKNIAHKDIKPGNILIDKYDRAKLGDFGLSVLCDGNLYQKYNGSLSFFAPEVICKKPHDAIKSDVWSFGVTLYYLAVGAHPFPARDIESLKHAVVNGYYAVPSRINPAVKNIIRKSLCINPAERISFAEMKNIVEAEIERMKRENPEQIFSPVVRKATKNYLINGSIRSFNKNTRNIKKKGTFISSKSHI